MYFPVKYRFRRVGIGAVDRAPSSAAGCGNASGRQRPLPSRASGRFGIATVYLLSCDRPAPIAVKRPSKLPGPVPQAVAGAEPQERLRGLGRGEDGVVAEPPAPGCPRGRLRV